MEAAGLEPGSSGLGFESQVNRQLKNYFYDSLLLNILLFWIILSRIFCLINFFSLIFFTQENGESGVPARHGAERREFVELYPVAAECEEASDVVHPLLSECCLSARSPASDQRPDCHDRSKDAQHPAPLAVVRQPQQSPAHGAVAVVDERAPLLS